MPLALVGVAAAVGGLIAGRKLAPKPTTAAAPALQPGVGPAPTGVPAPPPPASMAASSATLAANTAAAIARKRAAGGTLLSNPAIGTTTAAASAKPKTLLGY